MLLKPVSFLKKASSVTPEWAYVDSGAVDTNGANTDPLTVAGLNFGTADASRELWALVIMPVSFNQSTAAASVTIGGVSATQQGAAQTYGYGHVSLWKASVPTGPSGNVVVTPSGAWAALGVSLYRAIGKQIASTTATSGYQEDGTTLTLNANINVTTGQTILTGALAWQTYNTPALTGVTEDFTPIDWNGGTGLGEHILAGQHNAVSNETPRTVQIDVASGDPPSQMLIASYVIEDA